MVVIDSTAPDTWLKSAGSDSGHPAGRCCAAAGAAAAMTRASAMAQRDATRAAGLREVTEEDE